MAINITFYTKIQMSELQLMLDNIAFMHPKIFPKEYVLYKPKVPSEIQMEIALSFAFIPTTYFIIAMNNKSSSFSVKDMVNTVREKLGTENMIALFEGETLV